MGAAPSGLALILAVASIASACGRAPAGGQEAGSARAFFTGKTMTYVVATEPGGGYDTYGRLVARYIGKYLDVSRVVVKNVPGGGHMRGAHEIYNARPDGLTIGTFNSGLIYSQILRTDGVGLDLNAMTWLGKAGVDARVFVVSKASGIRSVDDIRTRGRPLVFGSSGLGTQGYNDALLLSYVLGVSPKFVFGLAANDAQLSMMRGEIEAEVGAFSSHRSFLDNGYGYALFRIGGGTGDEAAIPDGEPFATSDEARALVELIRTQAALLRWTGGPPGISPERTALLRQAYWAALADPELLREAAKLKIAIAPMDGETLAREIARVTSQPPRASARLAELLAPSRAQP
jgi:tripartite-type tricarboxylate transporter receptor subunit TctC